MTKPDETPEAKHNRLLVRLSILQLIPAIVGIFIATLALYAALNESDAVRKQQQAAVWPHMQVDLTNITTNDTTGITIGVSNRGIGPARVRAANVLLDGEQITSWQELFLALQPDASGFFPRNDSRVGYTVLVPGGSVEVVKVSTEFFDLYDIASLEGISTSEETAELVLSLREAFREDRVEMQLCYCSVFDDCWLVSSANRDPQLVDTCEPYIFENRF